MKKSLYTGEQIVSIVRALEAAVETGELGGKHAVSQLTFIAGRRSTGAWKSAKHTGYGTWKKNGADLLP